MTPEQAAAFVIAQSACAMAEVAAMQARNQQWATSQVGEHSSPSDFEAVIEKYCIGHDAVLTLFQQVNR